MLVSKIYQTVIKCIHAMALNTTSKQVDLISKSNNGKSRGASSLVNSLRAEDLTGPRPTSFGCDFRL